MSEDRVVEANKDGYTIRYTEDRTFIVDTVEAVAYWMERGYKLLGPVNTPKQGFIVQAPLKGEEDEK
jgi:hypothetical protein